MLIDATTQTTEGHVYILFGNDDLNVAADVTVRSTGTDAVTTSEGQHHITVSGKVYGHDDAINTIGCLDAQTVDIAVGGLLHAGDDGSIADADGVILDGLGSVLTNHGQIIAQGTGVSTFVRDNGTTTVANHGTIHGDKAGVHYKFGAGTLHLVNSGTIDSPLFSYLGADQTDIITNTGTMIGAISLGGGNDTYAGLGGKVLGHIDGGAGSDLFVPGQQADDIDGGEGIDTLDLHGATTAIVLDLADPSRNAGKLVAGDHFSGIENVIGAGRRDSVTGTEADNHLRGMGGQDQLSGGLGNDLLIGGVGLDVLTGGSGFDTFLFVALADRHDVITDFDGTADLIGFQASAFGFGEATGLLDLAAFTTGTTARAIDTDDRFILRTTDNTLWFDPDGAFGPMKSVLMADLQDGALFSASNITLL